VRLREICSLLQEYSDKLRLARADIQLPDTRGAAKYTGLVEYRAALAALYDIPAPSAPAAAVLTDPAIRDHYTDTAVIPHQELGQFQSLVDAMFRHGREPAAGSRNHHT
jgi:hypothetical protein